MSSAARKCAVLELWGLGDGVMMSGALRRLLASGRAVTVFCSGGTAALMRPSFPDVAFETYEAPWKAFRGKYRIWKWDLGAFFGFVGRLRRGRFDEIVSVRQDPRDHVLMWLSGAGLRYGFGRLGSSLLLSRGQPQVELRHKVEDWAALADAVLGEEAEVGLPWLDVDGYPGLELPAVFDAPLPVVTVHCGARIAVRRWRIDYFRELLARMRQRFEFKLVLMPDPDGYGTELADLADAVFPELTLDELVLYLGRSDVLVANDSAPAHVASAAGTPALTFFGPTSPEMFRPYGDGNRVVIRDLCDYRPCFDYCKFAEPHCMTKLTVDEVWPESERFLAGVLDGGDRSVLAEGVGGDGEVA